jgi:AmmeMemoRadiSam system protein B
MLAPLVKKSWSRVCCWLIFIGLTALLVLLFLAHSLEWQKTHPTEGVLEHTRPFLINEISSDLVLSSFMHRDDYVIDPSARILLIPHHLAAGREIASLLGSSPNSPQAVLLSPDHFSKGAQALSTTREAFQWGEHRTPGDKGRIDRLLLRLPKALRVQDSVFLHEHGVRGLIPFLQLAWQHTGVTPITVRVDTSDETITKLAEALHEELQQDPSLMLVITIDFSHELPAYLADLHDAYAIGRLNALDETAARKVEIDSPPLFLLLTKLTKLEGSTLQLQAHTNSLRLMNASVSTLGTSHVLMSERVSSTPETTSSHFTFFHNPSHPILSSEDRVYRGYDTVKTTAIPFPTAFVKEETATTTIWHAIPLAPLKNKRWEVVSDQVFTTLKTERVVWENWARTHLTAIPSE